jgi:hypothetical protein
VPDLTISTQLRRAKLKLLSLKSLILTLTFILRILTPVLHRPPTNKKKKEGENVCVMATGSIPGPQLHLTIDDETKNIGVGNTAVAWNPSNTLHGRLEISCMTRFEIGEASIFLEGGDIDRQKLWRLN